MDGIKIFPKTLKYHRAVLAHYVGKKQKITAIFSRFTSR